MKKVSFILTVLLIFTFSGAFAQDAQEIIKNVQNVYKNISDAKAQFTHSVKYKSGSSQTSSGTIYIQKEDKYRIETKNQILITDGNTSWSYSIKKKQVVIDNYKKDGNTFSPNKYLFNYPENFYSDYEGTETVNGAECYVLKLNPRSKGSLRSSKIWIEKDTFYIKKITVSTSESTDTYTLKKVDLNTGISSSKFSFSPPQDVEVIDLR